MTDLPAQPEVAAARKVELIVAQLDSLPTLPRVASQLLRMTRNDQATAREVIELIKQDQAVTAKILSLARRAGSGIRGEATTVDRCVLLLGLEAVRSAALSVKIFEIFDQAESPVQGGFNVAEFWKHSLAVALASERLAAILPPPAHGRNYPASEDLFVAGLLHDIGKAALHYCLPKSYAKVIEAAEAGHGPLLAIERRLLGIDHTLVGKRLAQRWQLPQGVIDSIWLHQGSPAALPESVARRGFAQVVHLADLLVRELRLGYSGNHNRHNTAESVAASMGLEPAKIDELRRWLPDELANRAAIIGFDTLDSRDLYHEALKNANEELARLNSRLLERAARLSIKSKCFDLLGRLSQSVRAGARPIEAAEAIARLLGPAIGSGQMVVFSEPPVDAPAGSAAAAGGASPLDPSIEGVSFDTASGELERFILDQSTGDVDGLSAARRAGAFEPTSQPGGHGLFPLSGRLAWVHSHLAKPMPLAGACLMPLLAEGRWVGGAIFVPAGEPGGLTWPASREELAAVASAAGLVMRSAQATAAAEQTAEELVRAAADCERLQDQIIRERALASVGLMAAGAGHELNNPLMVISGRSEMLAADEHDPSRREALEQIRANAQRASAIITELMDFAKPPPAQPTSVDLPEFARRLAEPLAASGIQVDIRAEPGLPHAWADPTQLAEVIQEILDNAQQAMAAQDQNRTLKVNVARLPLNGDEHLELTIIDTGVGMEPQVLEHATEPFFSARPAGRGRGLGLARARRLIEHNGGGLNIESTPRVGTTVRISVPAAKGPPE